MQDKGYDVTSLKCSMKFQALKHTYKGIVDYHNDMSRKNPQKYFGNILRHILYIFKTYFHVKKHLHVVIYLYT